MPAKHTPGPWAQSGGFIVAPNYGWKGRVVAQAMAKDLDTGTHDTLSAEANARLVAAAPDMLAALKALVPRFDWGDDHDIAPSGVASVRAAIAKAEGDA